MNGLDPRIARVEFWRRSRVGVSRVDRIEHADLVIVNVPSADNLALCFELPRQRTDLDTTIAALRAVYGLGRRDVIRQVRDIFEEPRGNG
ncbi:hypothetical protein [Bradyrhizobium sp.]|jgi:hypothetical protein|uniref:hypothetical protein n=1 Tax=Bradyrhizobium sp. TaxID=376 RepID=UPI0025BDBAB7|nr:hypothetical protein [Bradyrhizobium sp.]MCA3567265.1 hypothetical protein [Bradyrhizobium sp.]MCA3575785.1 hypothetical protein [Bradyrhizobium sp.]